jgi:integrase
VKIKQPKVTEIASVKNGETYKYFQVAWTDRDGKRQRKQFTDRPKAAVFASETHTSLINQGSAHRSFSTILSEPLLREAEACASRLGGKYTLTQATDYFLKHFQDPDFTITIQDASVKFRGAKEGVIRDRSLIQLKSTLGQFERFTENRNIHEVTSDSVEGFLNRLRSKDGVNKAARKTWNNYRADLHQFFEWCREKPQRYITANPVADVKRYTVEHDHIEVLNATESEDLMRSVEEFKDGKLVRYFALALFAGIRPGGELEKLAERPQAVDLENGVIKISAGMSKTGKARQVTIQPNLRQWLTAYSGDIFPTNSDRDLKTIRKGRLSHDVLRHTFVSMHVMAFDSLAQTAIQSGNSETIIRNHYLNVSTKAQAERFWDIVPTKNRAS